MTVVATASDSALNWAQEGELRRELRAALLHRLIVRPEAGAALGAVAIRDQS